MSIEEVVYDDGQGSTITIKDEGLEYKYGTRFHWMKWEALHEYFKERDELVDKAKELGRFLKEIGE